MAIVVNVTHEGKISPKTVDMYPHISESCNMFNVEALEKCLTYMTVKNYWSLYDLQKRKLNIERYDLNFSEFKQEMRLPTEGTYKTYSKRYVYYLPTQFIDYPNRKKYKQSKLYNTSVDFSTISENSSMYTRNFLLLIDGRFISTAEILPLEDKTCVIIDVSSSNDPHGIPLDKYREYKKNDVKVTVLFVPNFTWSRLISNRYMMTNSQYILPFSRFVGGENITKNNLLLINTTDKGTTSLRKPTVNHRTDVVNKMFVFNESILNEFGDTQISDSTDMISSYDFLSINFNKLHGVFPVDTHGYFKVTGKMPCPRENMLVFSLLDNGNIVFDHDLTVDLYYPNIYHISGKHVNCTYLVYCFYDDNITTETEEYANQISLYEKYVNLLDQYIQGDTPQVLKDWYPSEYEYSIPDYDMKRLHLYMPNTLMYKIFKMYDSIRKDPWVLKAYMDFLLCPSEKYYIDITRLNLSIRIRQDTTEEPIVEGSHYVFSEPHYVFAMNRRFLKKSRYDFRIWVDGLFIRDEIYHMELGLDYYYIYIPTRLINVDSMIEIERYKLFDFHTTHTFNNMEESINFAFDDELVTPYANNLYVVNMNTNHYIESDKFDIQIYSYGLQKYISVESSSFAILHGTVKLLPKDESILGIPLRIGIHKGTGMVTGEPYDEELYHLGDGMIVNSTNHGNYKSADYRVFNNGKLLLPVQWKTTWSETYGGTDSCQTSWALKKGDRVTVDHVPCSFRTVYYQADIPQDGLIDLDGKLNLPFNLKWYDVYLNGRRLHKNNVEIVSPTKFYIKNVNSLRHLIIYDRDRDNDIFFLSPHYSQDIYSIDRNDTIIDKLIKAGLADIIANEKDPIDNTDPDIGEPGVFGPGVLDAINLFLQFIKFKYIHCNYKLIPENIKKKFNFFINDDGVLGINSNIHPSGVLYKVINCNKGVENMGTQLTHESVETGLRELEDRFAITPLHSSNYHYALKGEFLCDPETGGTGIRHNDGTITLIDEINRKKEHIDAFEQKMILANVGRYTIYDVQFDDTSRVKIYFRGKNLLDNEILIERTDGTNIGKVALSIDTTILQKSNEDDILRWSNHDPSITIIYYTGKNHTNECTYTQVASRLGDRCIEINTPTLVISSIVLNLPENAITEDASNPSIETGDGIDLTKGVTLTDNNYTNPNLPENSSDSSTGNDTVDSPDCICPENDTEDTSTYGFNVNDETIEFYVNDAEFASLHFKINNGIQLDVTMESDGERKFTYTIPNFNIGDTIAYSITYDLGTGTFNTPWGSYTHTDESEPPENEDDPGDKDLYNPIGPVDDSELTDPMRCMVHSILIALREGGLQL